MGTAAHTERRGTVSKHTGNDAAKYAEYVLLKTFDDVRGSLGHDYGGGQRAMELMRRSRELARTTDFELWNVNLNAIEPNELRQAWSRVGFPRMARVEHESYRHATKSTSRTLRAWELVERGVRTRLIGTVNA